MNIFDLGRVNKFAIEDGFKFAKAGVNLREIDNFLAASISSAGFEPAFLGYNGFPRTACISVNEQVVHGVANDYVLKDGDMLTIDCGVQRGDMIVDAAETRVIGKATKEQEDLMRGGRNILDACMKVVKNGVSLYEILRAGHNLAHKLNLYIFPEFGGHTIEPGKLHGSFIPHATTNRLQLKSYHETKLKSGQIICLEPIVTTEKTHIILDEDGWTVRSGNGKLSVHYEHCMMITDNGYELIC